MLYEKLRTVLEELVELEKLAAVEREYKSLSKITDARQEIEAAILLTIEGNNQALRDWEGWFDAKLKESV